MSLAVRTGIIVDRIEQWAGIDNPAYIEALLYAVLENDVVMDKIEEQLMNAGWRQPA